MNNVLAGEWRAAVKAGDFDKANAILPKLPYWFQREAERAQRGLLPLDTAASLEAVLENRSLGR